MSLRSRAAVIATLTAVPLLALAPPALAHAGLVSTTPAAGSVITKSPQEVVLTFDEAVMDQGAGILVTDANGSHYEQAGTLNYGGATISIQLDPLRGPGTYTVAWRVVADDGDPQTQTYTFEYHPRGASGSTTPSASATSSTTASDPAATSGNSGAAWLWPAIAGFVVVVVVALVFAVRAGRRSGGSPE
jgi:methionine-rich copper-binding protein CopC